MFLVPGERIKTYDDRRLPFTEVFIAPEKSPTIEAPTDAMMFVRFRYDDGNDAPADEANKMYDEFKKSAYQEADLDTILASVRKTSRAMVVYEDNRSFGAGAEIAATIAEQAMFDLDAPIVRIGGPDIPAMPFAAPLEHYYIEPQPDHLYREMLELARS